MVDAELDRSAQRGPCRVSVAGWPEYAGTRELHRALAHAVGRLVPEGVVVFTLGPELSPEAISIPL